MSDALVQLMIERAWRQEAIDLLLACTRRGDIPGELYRDIKVFIAKSDSARAKE